jgi:hypothetical protein
MSATSRRERARKRAYEKRLAHITPVLEMLGESFGPTRPLVRLVASGKVLLPSWLQRLVEPGGPGAVEAPC